MTIKKDNILLIVGDLSTPGGVSVFWNSLLSVFNKKNDFNFNILEIGGHGKNIFGPIFDQWKVHQDIKSNKESKLAIVNPSLLNRSFFRDGLFAKQLANTLPFVVFFHGWDLEFEATVTKKYINFFLTSFGKAQKIFVLSDDFKEKIIEWGYKGEIIVITTTVDATLANNFSLNKKLEKSKTNTSTIKILFLSRIIKEKGIFELVDAFENLNKRIDNIELTIAGDGEEFNQLKNLVKNKKNIKLTGHVEGEEKITLLKESDIYILPSYTEGLPISVLASMLFGLPVITTKVGGLKKFFNDDKMGYFIEPKSTTDIENKIELILSDIDKLKMISKFNYEYAQKNLTNNVVAEALSNHLKELYNEK
jgi:glycosyltransferase involved in cell wall biosynthesis